MIYIIMFVAMCWLDWKLDTYVGFKFLGSLMLGGLIFLGGIILYSDKQIEVSTTQETFISGNFSEKVHKKMNSSQTVFTYSTKTGTKSIEADQILSFKKNQQNKIIITKYEYPKIAKVLFFMIGGNTTYRVELKEQ